MQYTERTDGARFNTVRRGPFYMTRKLNAIKREINNIPRRAANMALEFTMNNFDEERFVGKGKQKWPNKKRPNGRKILVDTYKLKLFNKISNVTARGATLVNNTPYAGKHNHPVGTMRGNMPGRKFMGHSSSLAKATRDMIVTRLNIAAKR